MSLFLGLLLASASVVSPARAAPEIEIEASGPLAPLTGTLASPQAAVR